MTGAEHRRLMEEIGAWQLEGLISPDQAARLRARYPVPASRNWALLITGILGSALIGLGIILLLGHNWENLTRPARALIAYLPLLAALGLSGWILSRDRAATPWREGVGAFLGLALGACLSLVAQTYQVGGSFRDLVLVWMILLIPMVYLLDAVMPALIYLAGITSWAIGQDYYDANPYGFWLLVAAVAPFAGMAYRREPEGVRKSWVFLGLAVSLASGVAACMRGSYPVMWFTLYAGVFGILLLAGAIWERPAGGRPLTFLGAMGLGVMVFLYSFLGFWQEMNRDMGMWWRERREWEQTANLAHIGALLVAYGVLLVVAFRRPRSWPFRMAACFPAVAVLLVALNQIMPEWEIVPAVLMNLYAFGLGLVVAADGVRASRLLVMNAGLALAGALLIARFFDSDMSILWRGVAFILLGAGFLAANVVMLRRRRAS